MKKKLLLLIAVINGSIAFAQVGVNTANPQATFDITAKNATGPSTNVDGFLAPRVDRQRAQSMMRVPTSTMIYVNNVTTGTQTGTAINIDIEGYYYFNGTVWTRLNPNSAGQNVNIYNVDGTLQGNRIVTQADKKLSFTGSSINAFSVDGNTFSVDAANNRVGIGTSAPTAILHVEGNQFLNAATTNAASKNALDINIGQDGFTYGNRTDNFGINMKTVSSADPGSVARINFGDIHSTSISGTGKRYLSFSVGKPLVELMYLTNFNGGQVGIGTSEPTASALVEMKSTTMGFLTPRMSTAQRDAINPKPEGLIIYNLDIHCLEFWNATQWVSTCSGNSGGGVSTITNCATTPLNGTYKAGTSMNSGNTVVLTVNVTQLGNWSASTGSVNGVTFSGSGNFTTLGSQNVTLTANGTPTSAGSFNYTFDLGGSTCARSITYTSGSGVSTITNCATTPLNGTYKAGTSMNSGNTVVLTVNVTQLGNWSASTGSVNGVTFSGSGNFTTLGSQNVTLTANGTPTSAGSFNYTFDLGGSTCARSITYTSGSGVSTITNCATTPLNGTYKAGTSMNSGNTVVLTVNVTQLGNWSASTGSVNGVTFSGSGNFTTLGSQNVTLTANGTPTSAGSFNYTFDLGGSTCTRSITYTSICIIGPSDVPGSFLVNGQVVSVTVQHNGYTIINSDKIQCGGQTSEMALANSWILGSNGNTNIPTTTTYTFSKPITDAVINLGELNNGQSVTFSAKNGGSVPVSISEAFACAQSQYTINGNTINTPTTGLRRNTSLGIKVSGSYYTSITITHNGGSNAVGGNGPTFSGTAAKLVLCNAK